MTMWTDKLKQMIVLPIFFLIIPTVVFSEGYPARGTVRIINKTSYRVRIVVLEHNYVGRQNEKELTVMQKESFIEFPDVKAGTVFKATTTEISQPISWQFTVEYSANKPVYSITLVEPIR